MTRIEGSRALVIGATGVLGTLVADRLSTGGARLVLSARDEARLAERAAPGAGIAVDLTDEQAPETIVRRATEQLGGIDVIVLAAGVVGFDSVAATAEHDLETLFTVNALAPMRIISSALPALRA